VVNDPHNTVNSSSAADAVTPAEADRRPPLMADQHPPGDETHPDAARPGGSGDPELGGPPRDPSLPGDHASHGAGAPPDGSEISPTPTAGSNPDQPRSDDPGPPRGKDEVGEVDEGDEVDEVVEVNEVDVDDDDDQESLEDVQPLEEIHEEPLDDSQDKQWYILKVQVNREDSIRDALMRRVKIAGLEDYFGDIIVPTEDVVEFTKTGRKRIVKRKLYPGYILVYMAINDDTWFLVRETPGIGDFTGSAGKPTPMLAHEVERILRKGEKKEDVEGPRVDIPFEVGDRVRVKDGNFQNFEGDVEPVDESNGRVTVMISIFNRSTPVEFEHWQIEKM
jgi:transcriptional antiterminator NusG